MSIPLDKLYHYIESIARDVCKDNIVIYRFFPHGSKKLDDLKISRKAKWQDRKSVEIYAYDQEPLSFKLYDYAYASTESRDFFKKANVPVNPVKSTDITVGVDPRVTVPAPDDALKNTVSAAPGTVAPPVPPEVADHLVPAVASQVAVPPTQYLVAINCLVHQVMPVLLLQLVLLQFLLQLVCRL